MAMNPMQKKARTSFLLGMFLAVILLGIVIGLLIMQIVKMKKAEEAIQYAAVYVLNEDVKADNSLADKIDNGDGTAMLSPKVSQQLVRVEYVPNNALTAENLRKYITETSTAKIDVNKGTVITTEMINLEGKQASNDVRRQEYNMIVLPTELAEGEHIDIRLRLPSGEDFIVLSKKRVTQTNSDTIWLEVSEDEILTMSNAIVEAYIMEGSLLYATTYVDAGMQGSLTPTYIASQSVIELMNANASNITSEAMSALRDRYAGKRGEQRGTINGALDGFKETGLESVQAKTAEEAEKMKSIRQQYVDGIPMQ